ncbi:MAG: type I methionyl aminopeptidase [Bacteroidetes bacterium]|nr:MAG: type I methionyl aminopeptidase [Bacteroidota bacterium]
MTFRTELSKNTNIFYKTDEEIELIRQSCLLVSKTLAHVASRIAPGVTGSELDKEAEALIRDHGAVPGFKGYNGFPSTLCISVNEVVVHGIPSDEPFQSGQVVSVDCGVIQNGFYGDAAYTFALGDVPPEVMKLLRVTKTSLYKGIEMAVHGRRLGDIGFAIQNYTQNKHGYSVVRELVGHGLGRNLHEDPEVPNYGRRGQGILMKEGMVIAIEPMINLGKKEVSQSDDGWTIFARDRKPSAHYEHSVAIRKDKADILSDHSIVEAAIERNPDVREVPMMED